MEVLTKILGGCGQLLNGIHQQAVCFYLLTHTPISSKVKTNDSFSAGVGNLWAVRSPVAKTTHGWDNETELQSRAVNVLATALTSMVLRSRSTEAPHSRGIENIDS